MPCSPPREADVEISCTEFRTVADAGGKCPDDTTNIVALFSELRAGLGAGAIITVASQASKGFELEMAVTAVAPFIDRFHLMSECFSGSKHGVFI